MKIKLKYILLFILILCLLYILYDNCRCIERFNISTLWTVRNIVNTNTVGIYDNREEAIRTATDMGENHIYIDIGSDYKPHLFVYDRNFRILFNEDGSMLLLQNTNSAIQKSLEQDSWLFRDKDLPTGSILCITLISVLDLNLLQLSNYVGGKTNSIPYQMQLWKNIREFSESDKIVYTDMNRYSIFTDFEKYPQSYRESLAEIKNNIISLFSYETRTQFYDLYQRFTKIYGRDDFPDDDFLNHDEKKLLTNMYYIFEYFKYIDDINYEIYDINYLYNLFESLYIRQYAYVKNEKVSIQITLSNLCFDAFDGDCSDTIGQKYTCLACLTGHDVKCIDRLNKEFCKNGTVRMKDDKNLLSFEEFLEFGRLEGQEDPSSIHTYAFSLLRSRSGIISYLMTNILLYYFNLTPEGDFRPTEYAQDIIPEYLSKSQELLSHSNFIGKINSKQPLCVTNLTFEDYGYIYSKLYHYNDILLYTINVFLFSDIVSLFKADYTKEYHRLLEHSSETQNPLASEDSGKDFLLEKDFHTILDKQVNRVLSTDEFNYKYREIYREIDKILNDLEFSSVTVEDRIVILGEYLKISQEIDIKLLHEIIFEAIPDPDL